MTLKEALKKKEKVIIGNNRILAAIGEEKIKEVFVSSNYPAGRVADLEKSSDLFGFKLSRLKIGSEELGAQCRKPYSVSVVGILK